MQPPRDNDDVRYWPRAEGGTGFPRTTDAPSRQYSALRTYDHHGNLTSDATPHVTPDTVTSMVAARPDYSPDTVKSRARAALVLAMQRVTATLADETNELKLTELSPVIASLGRISGVQDDEGKDTSVTIRIVRDTPVYNEGGAHVDNLPKDMGDQHLALPPSPDTSPDAYAAIVAHAEREVRGANAMPHNDFGIATSRDA